MNIYIMTDHKPGGSLSALPREVRDEIYRMVIGQIHLVVADDILPDLVDPYGVVEKSVSEDDKNFPILRVSKFINEEATKILYGDSLCRYVIDLHTDADEHSTPPTLSTTKRMMNLELQVDAVGERYDHWRNTLVSKGYSYQEETKQFCEKMILQFSGTEILRRSMRVKLQKTSPQFLRALQGGILQALKTLQGFEEVVIQVACFIVAGTHLGGDSPLSKFWEPAEVTRDAMRRGLEPALGPATTICLSRNGQKPYATCIEFHPRKYWANRLSVVKYSAVRPE